MKIYLITIAICIAVSVGLIWDKNRTINKLNEQIELLTVKNTTLENNNVTLKSSIKEQNNKIELLKKVSQEFQQKIFDNEKIAEEKINELSEIINNQKEIPENIINDTELILWLKNKTLQ